eukprot:SAG22_NODE_1854_length_3438_cov_2.648697_4_plen_46_part_00
MAQALFAVGLVTALIANAAHTVVTWQRKERLLAEALPVSAAVVIN